MPQSLLGSYSIETTDNEIYVVSFSIPDNCEYIVSGSAGAFTITIQLKKGETQPSTTFVICKETFSGESGVFKVDFEQVCDQTIETKPKIRVDY